MRSWAWMVLGSGGTVVSSREATSQVGVSICVSSASVSSGGTGLLEVELPALPDVPVGQVVPVRIEAVLTELGTLELWMKHANSDQRWKIEFHVRTQ